MSSNSKQRASTDRRGYTRLERMGYNLSKRVDGLPDGLYQVRIVKIGTAVYLAMGDSAELELMAR